MVGRTARRLQIAAVALATALAACSPPPPAEQARPADTDGRYDTHYPVTPAGDHLARIGNAVHMVSSIAYYKVYTFTAKERVRPADITAARLARAPDITYTTSTVAATAVTLGCSGNSIALLTCAHVITFADSALTFFDTDAGSAGPLLRSVAIKEKQTTYVAVLPDGGELEVLATDPAGDLAVLGKTLRSRDCLSIPGLDVPLGTARDLDLGTFVYAFGYPAGYRMLTSGLVSNPRRDRSGTFLLDAAYSRGYSGGPVFALRDGVPHFELVGIIKTVSGHASTVIVPRRDPDGEELDPAVPYTGEIFVQHRTDIDHSASQVIAAETVREFLVRVRETLRSRGIDLGHLLNEPPR